MKKFKIYIIATLILALGACSSDDATVGQDVLNTVERGAVLRTINLESGTYNAFDPTSEFSLVFQEQDIEDGGLMESVDVFVSFQRPSEDGKSFIPVGSEVLFSTIDASEFTTDEFKLPRTNLKITLTQITTALSLATGDFTGGDRFVIRLALNLTDGRVITFTDVASNVASSSFFRSPYRYFANVACIPLTPVPGLYKFELVDDYGDGWDGAFLTVTIDGVSTVITATGSGTDFEFTITPGTTSFSIVYTPGSFEAEHIFTIFLDGNVVAKAGLPGPPPTPGEVVLSICPT
ncbi:MAG: hypothetical protein CO119_06200 [Flavobacteriales bacterium CG_4_9_14_3_um_filter_40_17]|nr:MAG: hypothetical protein CO119_06200 [Flavobacteriales bacterium CG_4_9_14_3_um_filter_40_17]